MPLTLPNLDDRTYTDLVEEARSLLVTYAPDLTNHNPSEPLITFTELFAYFTEILLYRLNVVTDENRKSFLRLLNGPDRKAPDTRDGIDAEIRRTVLSLRETDRAVTPADHEFLACAVPGAPVARAKCIPGFDLSNADPATRFDPAPAHVSVVILPAGGDLPDIATDVAKYLEPRRLLTTRTHVVLPNYVTIQVRLTVQLLPDAREDLALPRISEALNAWFHPITGRNGAGWPFGRSVYVSEIYQLLDDLDGVDFVTRTVRDGAQLDELVTGPGIETRKKRNEDGLISVPLQPDELVTNAAPDITVVIPRSTIPLIE